MRSKLYKSLQIAKNAMEKEKIIQYDPDTPSSITKNMILKITPKFVSTNFSNIPLPSVRITETENEIVSACNKKPNDKVIRIVNNSISQPILIILESTKKPKHTKEENEMRKSPIYCFAKKIPNI